MSFLLADNAGRRERLYVDPLPHDGSATGAVFPYAHTWNARPACVTEALAALDIGCGHAQCMAASGVLPLCSGEPPTLHQRDIVLGDIPAGPLFDTVTAALARTRGRVEDGALVTLVHVWRHYADECPHG